MKGTIQECAERIIKQTGLAPVIEDAITVLGARLPQWYYAIDVDSFSARKTREQIKRVRLWCEASRQVLALDDAALVMLVQNDRFPELCLDTLRGLIINLESATCEVERQIGNRDHLLLEKAAQKRISLYYSKAPALLCSRIVSEAASTYLELFGRRPALWGNGPFDRFLYASLDELNLTVGGSKNTIRKALSDWAATCPNLPPK